jgi:tetratricopeptide (TPR) repeat protein
MPSLQDIREFNNSLVRLADEPEVVKGWGEEIEDLPEPSAGLDTDLSSLLADTGELGGEAEDAAVDLAGGPDEEVSEPDAPSEGEAVPETPETEDVVPFDELDAQPPSADVPGASEEVDFSDFEALLSGEPLAGPDESMAEEAEPFAEAPGTEEPSAEPPPWTGDDIEQTDETADEFDLGEMFSADEFPVPEEEPTEEASEPSVPPAEGEADFRAGADTSGEELPDAEAADEFDLGGMFGEEFDATTTGVGDETPEPDLDTGEFDGFSLDDEAFTFEDESAPPAEDPGLPDESVAGDESGEAGPGDGQPGEGELEGFDADIGAFEFSDEDDHVDISELSGDFTAFDEPAVPGAETSFEVPGQGEDETEFAEPGDLEDIDKTGVDDFSLGDFGAEFGVLQDDSVAEEDLNPAVGIPDIAAAVVPAGVGAFEITEEDFASFKETLHGLPLNLKIEIEGVITEAKGTTDEVEDLVRRLVARAPATDIAALVSRIVGTQIRIPRAYERRSGLEFETERQSFAYQFRENILPVLRLVALVVVAVGVLVLAGYYLVFRPLYGRALYREGLALIAEDQYDLGNRTFERALEILPRTRWFYEYAEAFIAERQYTLAAEKYEQLIFGMSPEQRRFFNELLEARQFGSLLQSIQPERQGVLDYARFVSETLGNYRKADLLLQIILFNNVADYDGWLAVGDNNMLWAEDEPSRFDDARVAYARLLERYGQTNELLFRMLTYFVRTDNLEEVLRLKDAFQAERRLAIEPERYSEMAGYLIDNSRLDDVEEVLFRVMETSPTLPDVHYQLARYYRVIGIRGSEEVALENARRFLEAARPLDGKLLGKLVDTHARTGENLYDAERFVDAQDSFAAAIENYEAGLRRRVLDPDPVYGRAYARLADILYYVGRQYDDALVYLNQAEANLYDEPNLDYKQGFILYRNGQLESALAEFRESATDPSASTNALLWATANTYYRRGNYFAAEAYYRELLGRVELQRDNIRFLLVDEDESHRSVIEYLIRVNNNLGVTLKSQYDTTLDTALFSGALVLLTEAIEYSENYTRDPDTLVRSSAVNLPYLNQRGILYPTPEYSLQIFNELPEDLDDLVF